MLLFNNIKDLTFTDILILLILVLSFKTLFFFTGFILEDSFIGFRAAFNLADFGQFSYNLGEINSATTSKVFGFICAFFRLIFKEYAILSIIVLNSIISFFSSLLILISLKKFFYYENKIFFKDDIFFLTVLIFLNPSISIIGIVGLEFSILVFFISLVMFGVIENKKIYLSLVLFIPLIRVELIGFVLILSFFYLYFLQWKNFLVVIIFSFFGFFFNFYLNNIFDGSFFPGTAVSKWNITDGSNNFSLDRILINLNYWFFSERSFFLGVYSKFIPNFIYTISGIAVLIYAFNNFKYLLINKFISINLNKKIFLMTISASVIFLPLSYVVAGHVWDWYLYPYSFLSYVLLAVFLINFKNYHKIKNVIIVAIFTVTIFQFLVLKNIGFQENSYRSVVGKDIYNISQNHNEDTLFLEPAGYIPFFAKIKTFDTEGLTSPKIFKYRNQYNDRWWLDFVEENMPTFIVDRKHLYDGFSHDGKYTFKNSEIIWLKKNYTLIKEYNYQEFVDNYSGIFKPFYRLGSHADYYLYKRVVN